MSLQFPFVTGGLVSIANGATSFTGSGTAFVTEGVKEGDIIFVMDDEAHPVPIGADAASNTALALPAGMSWQGENQVSAPYFIVRAVDAERVMSAAREFISLYNSSANLAELAALSLVTDKLVYADATNSLALADFKSWARSMFGLTMAANKYAYGTGANTMALGDILGAGRAALALTGAAGSFVRFSSSTVAVMQAIIGTVSQSAGVPTGAIVERGSNGNGEYVRFADGLQICTKQLTNQGAIATAQNNIFVSAAIVVGATAATFIAAPVTFFMPSGANSSWAQQAAGSTTTAYGTVQLSRANTSALTTYGLDCVAIGRWF